MTANADNAQDGRSIYIGTKMGDPSNFTDEQILGRATSYGKDGNNPTILSYVGTITNNTKDLFITWDENLCLFSITAAFATESDIPVESVATVSEAEELTAALGNGVSKIILGANITGTFGISYEVTIDLAGYTISNSNASGNSTHTITVADEGNLTITDSGHVEDGVTVYGTVDSVVNNCAALYVEVGGEATLNGGTYTRSQEAGTGSFDYNNYEYVGDSNGNSYYTIVNHGTMLINAGVTVINSGSYSSTIENGWYNPEENTTSATASLTIGGGTFSGGINTVKNDDFGELTIYGGTFENSTMYVVMNWNIATIESGSFKSSGGYDVIVNFGGTLTIGGGTFDASDYAFVLESDSNEEKSPEVVITGGTFIGTNDAMVIAIYGGTLEISGGTFVAASYNENGDDDGGYGTYYYYDVLYAWGDAEITVEDGIFEGWMETENNGTISITGGYFTLDPSNYNGTSYVAEGYVATATEFEVGGVTYTMYVVASENDEEKSGDPETSEQIVVKFDGLPSGDITSVTTIYSQNGTEIKLNTDTSMSAATAEKEAAYNHQFTIDSSSASVDGINFTVRLKANGSGKAGTANENNDGGYRNIEITVTASCTLTVYAVTASSSDSSRTFSIIGSDNSTNIATSTGVATGTSTMVGQTFTLETGTYYIVPNENINFYGLVITY